MKNEYTPQVCQVHNNVMLGSKIEMRENLCIACIEMRLKKISDLEIKVHDLIVENDFLKKQKEKSDSDVKMVQKLLLAETEGIMASDNHLSEDQNPYESGDERCVMWLNGWQSNENKRTMGKANAVIQWSVNSLDVVKQLAIGYGQLEIESKVDSISEKLNQFLEGK